MTDPVTTITRKSRIRWFPRRGHRTWHDRGFRSKAEATAWINRNYEAGLIAWTSGFLVKFKGPGEPIEIVDKLGRAPKL